MNQIFNIVRENPVKLLLLFAPIAIYWGFNYDNVHLNFSWTLALMAMPYALTFSEEKGNFRFAVISLLAGLILLGFRSNSLFYFSAVFLLLYMLESWWGRLNNLPILLVLIISPVISIMVYIWSFPIRLKLSEWAAAALRFLEMDITASGNVLILDGNTFSVDPACIGLKMVITSLVLGVLVLGYFEKKYRGTLSFLSAGLLLGFVLVASVFSNFTRLLALVLFHILPENILHEAIGIFSMLLYVLLPFYLLVNFILKRQWVTLNKTPLPIHKSDDKKTIFVKADTNKVHNFSIVFLLLLLVWNGVPFLEKKVESFDQAKHIQLAGFEKTVTQRGMLKFQNESALVYVKAPVRFFQGSHDPRYCWQGSGYVFSEVKLEQVGGRECYTAILRKGKDKLYTAWWYQNGTKTTPFEDWRWDSLRSGKGFSLVNVSCASRRDLEEWVGAVDF